MKESAIEKAVSRYVASHGGISYKFVSPARRSVPDRLVTLPGGAIFFIEFKAPGGKLTSGQEREIERLEVQGQRVYVVDSIGDGKLIVDCEAKGITSAPKK